MPRFRIPAFLASGALALALTASAGAAASPSEDLERRSSVEHMGALAQEKIPGPILSAIGAPGRPQSDRQLDAGRKPEQILAFYDIRPGFKVADLSAGATDRFMLKFVRPIRDRERAPVAAPANQGEP